jgi:hypothetical protein
MEFIMHVLFAIFLNIGLTITKYAFLFVACLVWFVTAIMVTCYHQEFHLSDHHAKLEKEQGEGGLSQKKQTPLASEQSFEAVAAV